MTDVNHSVLISGEDTLVKITFHVSLFVAHHMHGYTCATVQAIDCILCELVCRYTCDRFHEGRSSDDNLWTIVVVVVFVASAIKSFNLVQSSPIN